MIIMDFNVDVFSTLLSLLLLELKNSDGIASLPLKKNCSESWLYSSKIANACFLKVPCKCATVWIEYLFSSSSYSLM
ncbi:hypothetical protein IC582_001713 [Cucumis melo]